MSGGSYRIDPETGERVLVSKPFRSPGRAERRAAEQSAAEQAAAASAEQPPAEEPKPARRRGKTAEQPAAVPDAGDAIPSTGSEE